MATQATKVRKVLKVQLVQLAHGVLPGYQEKLVIEETWAQKVNQVTKG